MRDIFFRGKSVTGLWHYGDLHTYEGVSIACEGISYEVIPDTVGQFSGLMDSFNGCVFEGDIVRYQHRSDISSHYGEVGFTDGGLIFDFLSNDNEYNLLSFISQCGDYKFEVVDNIHDAENVTQEHIRYWTSPIFGGEYEQEDSDD